VFQLDGRALIFSLVLAVASAFLFGLGPAIQTTRVDLVHSLKAYRKGMRDNPLMTPMAKPLTDAEISDVAWYFSKQKGLVEKY